MKPLAAFFFAVHILLHVARAATGFETDHITLYQPDEVLRARLSNVDSLADYVKKLQAACTEFFATTTRPETLDIVIATKPGKLARVWFVSSTRADQKALGALRLKLAAVPALEVFGGPVAFAISAKIAGGDGRSTAPNNKAGPPIPTEWKEAVKDAKTSVQVPDGFLALVWPDPPGAATDVPAPPGFVNQVLEPLGGRIFRPQDWFYVEGHHGPVYMWTISREDSSGNRPYTTGVRIQLFSGIQKGAGKTAKQFILDFVADKKKEATRVIKSCEPENQGLFTRMCLETEEGPSHILYSLSWGTNNLDLAVVSIAGTDKELWDTYWPTFDRMREFELLNPKRMENPPMTRIEFRQIAPWAAPGSFNAKAKVLYLASNIYSRVEEQPDDQGVQLLRITHEPDIWVCDQLKREGKHQIDRDVPIVSARILGVDPPIFSSFELGKEARFFAAHHAAALPAQTLDGQACDVSEFKESPFRVVLFLRADTHQPFQLDVFKDDQPDFSIHYPNYQTDLPFDAALFTPPKDFTITENKPKGDK